MPLSPPPLPHERIYFSKGSAHKLKIGYTLILKLLIMEDSVKIRNSRPSRFTFSGLRRMYKEIYQEL